jgi:hypothetical protein
VDTPATGRYALKRSFQAVVSPDDEERAVEPSIPPPGDPSSRDPEPVPVPDPEPGHSEPGDPAAACAPPGEQAADPARDRRRRLWMSTLVIVAAAVGVWIAAVTDQRDTAVLFVGLPALLALGIAWRPRARSLHGAVASGTTFALLLSAMLMQEGAICVLLSAPLVFAVTHAVAGATRMLRRRMQAAIVLPLVVLASVEGIAPGWRIAPVQTVQVATVVDVPADELARHLAMGPDFSVAERPLLLRTGFPVPTDAHGDGLEPGDRWTFDYRGAPIVTEVTARDDDAVHFRLVHDGSKTARWLTWETASLVWAEGEEGTTDVTVRITFERGLDPSWWFGPVEDALVRAGAAYLLDALVPPKTTPAATPAVAPAADR